VYTTVEQERAEFQVKYLELQSLRQSLRSDYAEANRARIAALHAELVRVRVKAQVGDVLSPEEMSFLSRYGA